MRVSSTCDVAIVGAGLAGGLIARALRSRHPALDGRLIDASAAIGGNHVWSFFDSDIAPTDRWLVEPLIAHRWQGYDVAFPGHRRTLDADYQSVTSEQLDTAVRADLPPDALMLGRAVVAVEAQAVHFAGGEVLSATGVIDARGAGDLAAFALGWQNFLGQELVLAAPHGLNRPIVMDASVAQLGGYRFVYCLPFASDRVFVEDTYYADLPGIDRDRSAALIADYAAAQGWRVAAIEREEVGALPVVMDGDFEAYWASGGEGIPKAGMRAGLFHPTTGYSLPDAVRTAAMIARLDRFDSATLHTATHAQAAQCWRARGFYRLLSRMLFRAAHPAERYRILERFYRLDPALIGRFYAGETTTADKLRILAGKPPVSLIPALRAAVGDRKKAA